MRSHNINYDEEKSSYYLIWNDLPYILFYPNVGCGDETSVIDLADRRESISSVFAKHIR